MQGPYRASGPEGTDSVLMHRIQLIQYTVCNLFSSGI